MKGISKWTLVFTFGVAFLLAWMEFLSSLYLICRYDTYGLLSKKMTEATHTVREIKGFDG